MQRLATAARLLPLPRWRPTADLDAPDALELLARAPDPASAARLTTAQVAAALKRARRRKIAGKTAAIRAALRSPQLAQPPQAPAVVRSLTAVITAGSEQVKVLEGQVQAHLVTPGR